MIEESKTTFNFIKEHLHDDVAKLLFQKNKYPNVNMAFAVQQIAGYKKAVVKIPSLAKTEGFLYPVSISMEQCSSEYTAEYKSQLLQNKKVIDITGGLGIDDIYIAEKATEITYIEQNTELFEVAKHNFGLLNKQNIIPVCADGVQYITGTSNSYDYVYLDPSRRDANKQKVFTLADCTPNILECKELLLSKANNVLLKASPMLDIFKSITDLQNVTNVHVVSVDNECKELLFVLGKEKTSEIQMHCINILSKTNAIQLFQFLNNEEQNFSIQCTSNLKTYLYEPNSSILKAGAFKTITKQFNIEKLHNHSHLYTSNKLLENFPGKIFEIEHCVSLNDKTVKEYIPNKKINIVVRNFPMQPVQIQKKYKLQDGGEQFMFATTLNNNQKVIILCKRVYL